MRKLSIALVLAISLLTLGTARSELLYQEIDMVSLGLGNASASNLGSYTPSAFPFGNPVILGGVPFILTDQPNQFWSAALAPGGGNGFPSTVSVTFPMAVTDIYGFYTLANLWWGFQGLETTKYIFTFSDSSTHEHVLKNGMDIRDFNVPNPTYATTINGTTTRNMYADPFTSFHLDRQWIDLAAAGHGGKNLVSFTVEDTGGWNTSRVFLAAATAQIGEGGQQGTAVPEPGTWAAAALLAGGAAFARWRKRAKVS